MANQEHLDILLQGRITWNEWRNKEGLHVVPDLSELNLSEFDLVEFNFRKANLNGTSLMGADLTLADFTEANLLNAFLYKAYLSGTNFTGANLSGANLSQTDLYNAHLQGANLSDADLNGADMSNANLSYSDLSGANLSRVNLGVALLIGANLTGANLSRAILVETNMEKADLTNCSIYGISAWDVELIDAKQDNLIITTPNQPTITVDNLKIAQFIYLLLNNQEIRDVIDTIAKKAVLILGRFTSERKAVLDALRDALRFYGYLPILFDFDKPSSQDFTETVSTLAHLSRFIIADLTDPSSIPQELYAIVPHRLVPVQPLLKESEDPDHPSREYSMFIDLRKKYHWILPTHRYKELKDLLVSLREQVINPAEKKAQELAKR